MMVAGLISLNCNVLCFFFNLGLMGLRCSMLLVRGKRLFVGRGEMQEAAKGLKHVILSLPDPGAKERFISRGWVELLL